MRIKKVYNFKHINKLVYIVPRVIVFTILFALYYQSKLYNDALLNGEQIDVKVSDISYGRQANVYFYYRGAVCGVKYYNTSQYHVGDSIKVLYSKKYNYFILVRPGETAKSPVPEIASILVVIFAFWLIFKMDKKTHGV